MTLYQRLLSQIQSDDQKCLVLVENQLMERRLRTRLQKDLVFFAPEIKTVDTWIKENVLRNSHVDFPQFYSRILTPIERAYALTEWQQINRQTSFITPSDRAMLLRYLSDFNRAERTADDFLEASREHKKKSFPKLLKEFVDFLQDQKWLDRERIAGFYATVETLPTANASIILFDLQQGPHVRNKALEKFESITRTQNITWITLGANVDQIVSTKNITAKSYHTSVEEFRHIFDEIGARVASNEDVHFSDFVIFCPKIDDVRLSIDIAHQFTEIPLYITKPQSLSSHPLTQRILSLFSMAMPNTEIDDFLLVFEDNLFNLNFISGKKIERLNLRSVKAFCRKHNLRTFLELFKSYEELLTSSINNNDNLSDEQKYVRLQDELAFYGNIVAAIQSLLKTFNRPATTISAWIDECFIPLLHRQEKFPDEIVTSLRNFISSTLENFSKTHSSLQMQRKVTYDEAVELIKTLFAETSEPLSDHPMAVTLTEPGHFTLLDDKFVFFTGLIDGAFPRITRTDYVRFTYSKQLNSLLNGRSQDDYERDEAIFNHVLSSSKEVLLSYPRKAKERDVNQSPFLVEWLKRSGNQVINGSKETLRYSENATRPNSEEEVFAEDIHRRRLWNRLGIYDGVLSLPDEAPSPEIEKEINRWIDRSKDYLTVSDLNAYIKNPLHFFFEKTLGLSPMAQYQDDVEMDTRGLIIHEIAEQFFGNAERGELISPWSDDFLQRAKIKLEADIQWVFEQYSGQMGNERTAIPTLLRSKIRTMFFRWLEIHNEAMESIFKSNLTPVGVLEKHKLKLEQEFKFDFLDMSFKGKIDRIDVDEPSKSAFVVDYKSGSNAPNTKTILAGGDLQIPVYMKFLMTQGYHYLAGGYWKLNPNKPVDSKSLAMALSDDDLIHEKKYLNNNGSRKANAFSLVKEQREKFLEFLFKYRIKWLDSAIKQGVFNPSFSGGGSYNQEIHWISRSHLPYASRANSELEQNISEQGELKYFYTESKITEFLEKVDE